MLSKSRKNLIPMKMNIIQKGLQFIFGFRISLSLSFFFFFFGEDLSKANIKENYLTTNRKIIKPKDDTTKVKFPLSTLRGKHRQNTL